MIFKVLSSPNHSIILQYPLTVMCGLLWSPQCVHVLWYAPPSAAGNTCSNVFFSVECREICGPAPEGPSLPPSPTLWSSGLFLALFLSVLKLMCTIFVACFPQLLLALLTGLYMPCGGSVLEVSGTSCVQHAAAPCLFTKKLPLPTPQYNFSWKSIHWFFCEEEGSFMFLVTLEGIY